MIRKLIIILFSISMIYCEKYSNDIELKNNLTNDKNIDTTIFLTDTLKYSFGYFGDEEGISIIYGPQHAESCEILNKHWEERILQYIPADEFLGTDTLIIETEKGSDGAGPSTEIDSFLIEINIVKHGFHKKLIGKWNWISSCGGFTGGCWYPSNDNYEEIEFTSNMRYIEKYNDSIIQDTKYHFIDSHILGVDTIYEIGFENGYDTYYRFTGDTLNVQGGDFWKQYERIE